MSDGKKRRKAYYIQSSKTKKPRPSFQLDSEMKGFLITCNNTEKKAVREAYNVFNEYADMMYGSEQIQEDGPKDQCEYQDFGAAICDEVEALNKRDISTRRFQVVETKTNNCIFIKTTLDHPEDLVTKLFTDLCESQKSKSRFILKLFPVLGTCKATEDKIETLAEEILRPYLSGRDDLTFCVIYKVRCNNSLGRDAVIQLVARVASRLNPSIKVKFDDPELVISIDVLQKICCLSVLKNFNKFKKYNVQEVTNTKESASGGTECEKELGKLGETLPEDNLGSQEELGKLGETLPEDNLGSQSCPETESKDCQNADHSISEANVKSEVDEPNQESLPSNPDNLCCHVIEEETENELNLPLTLENNAAQ